MPTAGRIAFVCPRFAEGATVGGAETLLRKLAEHAASTGYDVTFLTTCATNHFTWTNEFPPGRRRVGQLDVHFFPVDENRDLTAFLRIQQTISRRGHTTEADELTWLRNSVNSNALCRHLGEHGREYQRIILGPYLFGLTYFASRIHPARTLLVPCLHDEGFAYVKAIGNMFESVGGILFNSEPERNLARRLYHLPDNRCAVVGMGLDPFDASPAAFAERWRMTSPYLIYSGRREAGKGVPLLLNYTQTFRERTRRDLKLVFTGSGPLEPPPALEPHILDLGFVSEPDKQEAMAGAAAFCHPSIYESFSIVIMESWLARTPVLAHGRCDVTRYHCQKSRGGLWFRMYPEFEEALMFLLDNPDLRRALGESGRSYVLKEYAWKAIEQRLFQALERLGCE